MAITPALEPTRTFENVKLLKVEHATGKVWITDVDGKMIGNVYSGGATVVGETDILVRKDETEVRLSAPAKCSVFATHLGPILSCKQVATFQKLVMTR